jgi:hypothetical protein
MDDELLEPEKGIPHDDKVFTKQPWLMQKR